MANSTARATTLMLLLATIAIASPAVAQEGILVGDTVQTIALDREPIEGDPPVEQSYILIEVKDPRAILLLFAGGGGQLNLADGELETTSTNFLVRSRHLFAALRSGFNVVVPDAASDILMLDTGLRGLRTSEAHLSDIAAVIEDVKGKVAGGGDLPVCLIGTSRGTISAAAYAATAGVPAIDCLVLTAPVTEPSGAPNESLDDVALSDVPVPTLLAAHRMDACFVTPPSGLQELKAALIGAPKVKVKLFSGGVAPLSDACQSLSPHGFFGIESRVAKAITQWIAKQVGP